MTSVRNILRSYLLGAICLGMTVTACKKDNHQPDQPSEEVTPKVTPQGIPQGPAVSKQIGAAGGTVQSADGTLKLLIPAGALSAATAIGIEPITNTNIAGIGTAFRLTPHGQHFDKPVSIVYSWAANADSVGLLQTLGLAYQQEDNTWKFVGAHDYNATQKTVTFNTTHFSDWSMMNQVSLVPYHADLEPGAKQTIQAVLFTKRKDDGLVVPIPNSSTSQTFSEPGYPVGNPITLPSKYIGQFKLAGPGTLTTVSASTVEYTAPASVNSSTTAVVSLQLKAPDTAIGQYLIVCNINIGAPDFIELSIGGGTPVTFPATPVVRYGNSYLLANPSDEGGGYFLLRWTDGIGVHPFDMTNNGNHFHFQTPQTTYISTYRPTPQSGIIPSGGSINVTRVSGGRAEGTFNVTNAGYGLLLTDATTAMGRFKVKLAN
ncbi:MAG: hypothetical protein JST39_03980 [Bacteroidetes bacterium]|nr:hypothetical protein [Bacteroidota bacterium]